MKKIYIKRPEVAKKIIWDGPVIFKNTEYPKRSKDLLGNVEDFSVDIICYSSDEILNIGYWNYDTERWMFHTDTLTDMYEGGELQEFVWMYKPNYLTTKK